MAGKVFFGVAMTLDGFIAPEQRADDPEFKEWMAQWMQLQHWAFKQWFARENLKLGAGGDEGVDHAVLEDTYNRTGASVLGKRMFDGGEHRWPDEVPRALGTAGWYHVLLRQRRHRKRFEAGP